MEVVPVGITLPRSVQCLEPNQDDNNSNGGTDWTSGVDSESARLPLQSLSFCISEELMVVW